MNSNRLRLPHVHRRVLSLFDSLAGEPVWRRALIVYLVVSSSLWAIAGLVHHEHGVAALVYAPVFAVPLIVAANVANSVVREVLHTPLYFAALAGILLAVSRLRPGKRVSFRELFSLAVHAGYILLAGHALRIALAASGVEFAGPAVAFLPDPDAMFLPDSAVVVPPEFANAGGVRSDTMAFATLSDSPADIPAVGVFDTAFHALLGVAYCRLRGGTRLIVGAAWGTGLSLLVDIVWLLVSAGY